MRTEGLKVRISNFKSIGSIELDLAPLTLLIGPPASGKSSILDALALIGYFNKFLVINEEYGNNASNLEPPQRVLRFTTHDQLFRYYDLTRRVNVEIVGKEIQATLDMGFEGGRFYIKVNDVHIPWDLTNLALYPDSLTSIRSSLSQATKDKFIESRLYGYDRYGLAMTMCTAPGTCGFHLYLGKRQERSFPRNIMSELGWNASHLIRNTQELLLGINNIVGEHLGERIEIMVLRDGRVAVFDYHYEVEADTVSESIFRVLYYLMALRTATNYVKVHGLEGRFILLLEEPEAHVFPFFLNLLVDYIVKAMDVAYVVVTTHNPMFVSILWDKVRSVRTYYVHRDDEGSTRAYELDIEKLAVEMKTVEELLLMPPREVLDKLVVRREASREAKR